MGLDGFLCLAWVISPGAILPVFSGRYLLLVDSSCGGVSEQGVPDVLRRRALFKWRHPESLLSVRSGVLGRVFPDASASLHSCKQVSLTSAAQVHVDLSG